MDSQNWLRLIRSYIFLIIHFNEVVCLTQISPATSCLRLANLRVAAICISGARLCTFQLCRIFFFQGLSSFSPIVARTAFQLLFF